MSGRSTAEIVADLRGLAYDFERHNNLPPCIREAADRLTELDAEWQTLCRVAHASALFQGGAGDRDPVVGLINSLEMGRQDSDELERIDALRPPCPTCDGSMVNGRARKGLTSIACPDCVDGKVSIEQLVATWRAVWDEDYSNVDSTEWLLRHLREVRP